MNRLDLLLVDDSPVALAFLSGVLGDHYTLRTAGDATQALVQLAEATPAAALVDLSMPGMSGEELIARIRADEKTRALPIVVVSSEIERGSECVRRGDADAFVAKPVPAEELRLVVARVLEQHDDRIARAGLGVLYLRCGSAALVIPLEGVEQVVMQPATVPLEAGPPHMREYVELTDEALPVLDLPARLGLSHARALTDRMLVIVKVRGRRAALCVDDVREPEILPVQQLERTGPSDDAATPLGALLLGFASTSQGRTPILEPSALFPSSELDGLVLPVRDPGGTRADA